MPANRPAISVLIFRRGVGNDRPLAEDFADLPFHAPTKPGSTPFVMDDYLRTRPELYAMTSSICYPMGDAVGLE